MTPTGNGLQVLGNATEEEIAAILLALATVTDGQPRSRWRPARLPDPPSGSAWDVPRRIPPFASPAVGSRRLRLRLHRRWTQAQRTGRRDVSAPTLTPPY